DGKVLVLSPLCRRALGVGERVLDAWGHPIDYRRPGRVHPRGWDLYSFGPNGVDEGGEGDDILVGEDVASVSSDR
ncbi:MAG: type II secretion system protein GspG, partial [Planctomycetota bacterium]